MSYPMPRVAPPALAALALLAAGCLASDTSVLDEGQPVETTAQPISVNALLEAMAHDLDTIAPAERANVRYVTLTHLHNAGASKVDMDTYRAAMSLALNSVSSGRTPTLPVPVDANAMVFRIHLDDYGWDTTTWQRLVEDYPYNVRYETDSPWFELPGELSDELRAEMETSVPYVYGDWLVSAAMQPPLYHDLLALPDTLDALEAQLGVDTLEATEDEHVDRAGFVTSGVSTTSRMIARFALPDRGALWTSCDLEEGASILDEPVDPICESLEVIFTLPNGLPAYYAAGAARDGQVTSGLSCMNCHAVTGTLPKNDQVRDFVLTNGASASDLDQVLALYPPRAEMSDLMTDDQNTFVAARRASGADAIAEPFPWVAARYDLPLDARDAAATLGIDEDTFLDMVAVGANAVPPDAGALLRRDGTLPRATWNLIFADMVCGLGLGACD